MNIFHEVQTVGELRALLQNLPDETVLFQSNAGGGTYRKQIQVLNINKSDERFDACHKKVKTYQCLEDRIKGTHNNLENIVIFGS